MTGEATIALELIRKLLDLPLNKLFGGGSGDGFRSDSELFTLTDPQTGVIVAVTMLVIYLTLI